VITGKENCYAVERLQAKKTVKLLSNYRQRKLLKAVERLQAKKTVKSS
jgi:hypothetical protein